MRFQLLVLMTLVGTSGLTAPPTVNPDQPLAVRATVADAVTEGPIVRGSMRLTIVNGGPFLVRGLKLHLVTPATGAIGNDPIDVGDVERDATVVITVSFRLEKSFMDSTEALTMEAQYQDDSDSAINSLLQVARDGGVQ